jgi:hypothetical protein
MFLHGIKGVHVTWYKNEGKITKSKQIKMTTSNHVKVKIGYHDILNEATSSLD